MMNADERTATEWMFLTQERDQLRLLIEQQKKEIEELKRNLYSQKVITDGLKENLNSLTVENADLAAAMQETKPKI